METRRAALPAHQFTIRLVSRSLLSTLFEVVAFI
jgi:hypothetical protein